MLNIIILREGLTLIGQIPCIGYDLIDQKMVKIRHYLGQMCLNKCNSAFFISATLNK